MASSSLAQAPAPPHRGRLLRSEAIWFYVFISPWILGFILFAGGPILASSYLSLTHNDPVNWPPKWIGLLNYEQLIHDPLFYKSLLVTVYYVALEVPLSVVFAVIIALLLNQKIPFLSLWRTVYYLPAVTAGVAVALMWGLVFNSTFGLLNGVLYSLFGIVGPNWLLDPNIVIPTFVIMGLWQFGGPMLIYLAGIQAVPSTLFEAAEIDGANVLQKMWHVTIPSITPVIFFNLIMGIIGSFQTFTPAFILTQGGPDYASYFYVFNIYQNAFTYISNMGYADALSWILFMVMLLFTLLAFQSSHFWVHYESPNEGR
ncbi:MAG TPA: sugar ABC transporter permease [Chloroflexota bacterium]|nr:sugar ABC transporter permease [Chloroflexota bacterium]